MATPHPTEPNQLDEDIDEILIKGIIAYTGNDKLFFTLEPTRQAIKSLIAKAQTEARIKAKKEVYEYLLGFTETDAIIDWDFIDGMYGTDPELNKGVEG